MNITESFKTSQDFFHSRALTHKKSDQFLLTLIDNVKHVETFHKDKEIKNNLVEERRPNVLLKDELSKPIINTSFIEDYNDDDDEDDENLESKDKNEKSEQSHKSKKSNKEITEKLLENVGKSERNINKIIESLNNLGFNNYFNYYKIPDSSIKSIAALITYRYYPRNSYIYKREDDSGYFYGIISGEVSIRKESRISTKRMCTLRNKKFKSSSTKLIMDTILNEKNNNNCADNSNPLLINEISLYRQGMCFGEWDLIKDVNRQNFAYATENTECFLLKKEFFKLLLSKDITITDIDKKNFVAFLINPLKMNQKKNNPLITPLFYFKNQFIYTEHDPAIYLYVLYQGECIVKKFDNLNLITDPILESQKMIPLYTITKGNLFGLETIDRNCKYYISNTQVKRDFTVVYRLKLSDFHDCNITICNKLRPLYEEYIKFLSKISKKYSKIEQNKGTFRFLPNELTIKSNFFSINDNKNSKFNSKIEAFEYKNVEYQMNNLVNYIKNRPKKSELHKKNDLKTINSYVNYEKIYKNLQDIRAEINKNNQNDLNFDSKSKSKRKNKYIAKSTKKKRIFSSNPFVNSYYSTRIPLSEYNEYNNSNINSNNNIFSYSRNILKNEYFANTYNNANFNSNSKNNYNNENSNGMISTRSETRIRKIVKSFSQEKLKGINWNYQTTYNNNINNINNINTNNNNNGDTSNTNNGDIKGKRSNSKDSRLYMCFNSGGFLLPFVGSENKM